MNAINEMNDVITIPSVHQLRDLIEGREGVSYMIGDTYMALKQSPYKNFGGKVCILENSVITVKGRDYRQLGTPTLAQPITDHQWIAQDGYRYLASATFVRV